MKNIISRIFSFLSSKEKDLPDLVKENMKREDHHVPVFCFSVFESALKRWEKYNSNDAPVWLNYHYNDDALSAAEVLKEKYGFSDMQVLGSVVIISGDDIEQIIKIIKNMEVDKRIQLDIYKTVNQWKSNNKDRNDNSVFSMKFENESKAIQAKNSLKNDLLINGIEVNMSTITMSNKTLDEFCDKFEKIHLESKYYKG